MAKTYAIKRTTKQTGLSGMMGVFSSRTKALKASKRFESPGYSVKVIKLGRKK